MDRDNASTATQANTGMTRRGVMRATAVGVGAAAGVGAIGSTAGPVRAVDWSDVGTIAASTVVGGPIGLGWALRDTEVLGSNQPPEGLTSSALKQDVYETVRTRKSTNASTFVDNNNIIDGVENVAYTEAKKAGLEALNAGKTKEEVTNVVTAEVDEYETTIKKNLLKTWNESVRELEGLTQRVSSHPSLGLGDIFETLRPGTTTYSPMQSVGYEQKTHTFPNGDTFTIETLFWNKNSDYNYRHYSPVTTYTLEDTNYAMKGVYVRLDGNEVSYLYFGKWNSIWTDLGTAFGDVRTNIQTWASNVYSSVQSGEVNTSDLITPRDRANMLSSDETKAQAISDLSALNIPIDSERRATISIPSTGARLSGTLGLTDSSDGPLNSGTTYDPSQFAGDVYLTTDLSKLSGKWTAYNSTVDNGIVTLTEKPYEGTILTVTVGSGESVTVSASEWSQDGSGNYTYDSGSELADGASVESVTYGSEAEETQYETIKIEKPFILVKLVNEETGETEDSAEFTSREPQTDSNYITQEEWSQLEQQNEELIEKYEESQTTSGGGGGFLSGGGSDIQTLGIVAGGAALAALLFGNR